MTLRTSLVLLVLFGIVSPARAQDLNWAEKMFDKRRIDFGVVARGADVSYNLRIKNLYQQAVHISDVRTSCGCSIAGKPDKTTLKTGEETHVKVAMDTRRFMRKKTSSLIVLFDRPLRQEVRIPLSVYIRSDVVLKPGSVNFGAVAVGAGAHQKLTIAYAGREDWKIRDVKTGNEYVDARVVETSRGNGRVGYDLIVDLKETAPIGPIRDQLTLVTDDVSNPHVPVAVQARVEADIVVTPPVLTLGTLAPGESKSLNVVLRGREQFEIAKIECEHFDGAFKVRLPKEARTVHVLPLTFTAPSQSGELDELFTITIPGRPQPVTFRAQGTISQ